MRIGLTGSGATVDRIVAQAQRAEDDGFASMWYSSAVTGDPLVAMTLAGRATSTIELGTAVLQTYACHPTLQAARAAAAAAAIGTPGRFTLGVGPTHRPVVEGTLGMSYETPGRHTEEYVRILAPLLDGGRVTLDGAEFRVDAGPLPFLRGLTVPVLVGALAPRLLRVAGQHAAGTVTWMANAAAIADHVAPRIRAAAEQAGRPAPRIVVGVPVAVHDDLDEARATAAAAFAMYGMLPNYQRILAEGGVDAPERVAAVGNEDQVTETLHALVDAGATDIWAAPFPVGADAAASRARTRALLARLASS